MESNPKQRALPSGYRLEEYEIVRELGSGGFGITYLARDVELEREVVIKENLPVFAFRDSESSTVHPNSSVGEDGELFEWSLENFTREARTLAKFDHPNIVKVLRVFRGNGTAYFVMPYVAGESLDQVIAARMERGESLSGEEVKGLLQPLLDALEELHAESIYHRDIKPGNILVTEPGHPVLIDFGAARQRISEKSMTVVESPGYTPFEQLQSQGNVGPWSDLYGLAGTFYKAITGETPPKANDRVKKDPIRKLAEEGDLAERFGARMLGALDRALAFDEEDRPQTAEEMRELLESPQEPTSPRSRGVEKEPESASSDFPNKGRGLDPRDESAVEDPGTKAKPPGELAAEEPGEPEGMAGTKAGEVREFVGIEMVWCPPGEFLMGSPEDEEGRSNNETQHVVRLTKGFWLAKTECTQGQWESVMGSNPSELEGSSQLPVETVSWNDVQGWLAKMNAKDLLSAGWDWELPTEAQWEYACRAGTTGRYGGSGDLSEMGWYNDNSWKRPHEVGTKKANDWGFYDMHGNVWEWCCDRYWNYPSGKVRDPKRAAWGVGRVVRGGSWFIAAQHCRSADRDWLWPGCRLDCLGFRPALVPSR